MENTSKKSMNIKTKLFIIGMLIIPVSNFVIFWLLLNFDSILMAFQFKTPEGIKWGFKNFEMLWTDLTMPNSVLLISLKNTMIFFFSSLLIILPVSLILCYFIYKRIWGYKFFRFVFYLPSIISASVLVVLFKYIIASNGPVGVLFEKMGWEKIHFLTDSHYALKTILFYTITMSFGGNIILLSGAMTHIDESIVEAAQLDGVSMFREMIQIVIPLIWPTLTTLIIFQFVGIFSASGPILLFTKGAFNTSTISYWIYEKVKYSKEYFYPSAIGLVCTIIATPIALGIRTLLNKTLDSEGCD